VHCASSPAGTTSVCEASTSPVLPPVPPKVANRLPRSGTRALISAAIPAAARVVLRYSAAAVSLPVGITPVLVVSIRTRPRASATISSWCCSAIRRKSGAGMRGRLPGAELEVAVDDFHRRVEAGGVQDLVRRHPHPPH